MELARNNRLTKRFLKVVGEGDSPLTTRTMSAGDRKRDQCWRALRDEAAKEEDPQRLMEFVLQIDCLLDILEKRTVKLDCAGFQE
jgi:hypothetical protein